MKYNITKSKAPEMPTLGKGTECIKLLLSQASKDMHAPLIPMLFPVLGAQVSDAEFQYPDLTWKEMCGQNGQSGGRKWGKQEATALAYTSFRGNKRVTCITTWDYKHHKSLRTNL